MKMNINPENAVIKRLMKKNNKVNQMIRLERKIDDVNYVIRSANQNDALILKKWWNDGKVMAHAGFPLGLDITLKSVKEQIKRNDINHQVVFIIELNAIRIGEMSYHLDKENDVLISDLGIKICEHQYTSKGYGPIFLKMLISYLFNELSVYKIVLDTNLKNIRAQKCYEKIGFKKVKVVNDAWKDQLGISQSAVDYELFCNDFLESYD